MNQLRPLLILYSLWRSGISISSGYHVSIPAYLKRQELTFLDTSHLLVSATVVVLRCAIEAPRRSQMQIDSQRLFQLQNRLRSAQELYGWDLADSFLERCTISIEQIAKLVNLSEADALVPSTATRDKEAVLPRHSPVLDTNQEISMTSFDDLFIPTDSLDYPWEALWSSIEDMW